MEPKQHGIIGGNSLELEEALDPEMVEQGIQEEEMVEDKKMARFSKTAEFKRLKDYIEHRIEHFQTFLPDGRVVGTAAPTTKIPSPEEWAVANLIIAEFKSLLSQYESAAEAVKDAARR